MNQVVVSVLGGQGGQARGIQVESGVVQVKFLSINTQTILLVILLKDGFKMYTPEGTRMVSFRSISGARDNQGDQQGDSASVFCRGICTGGKNSRDFFIGDSAGRIHCYRYEAEAKSGSDPVSDVAVHEDHREAQGGAIVEIGGCEKFVCSGDDSGNIVCYSAVGGDEVLRKACFFRNPGLTLSSIAVRNYTCISTYTNGQIQVHNLKTQTLYAIIAGHSRAITAMDVYPLSDEDGKNIFCTVGEDSIMSVWTYPNFEEKDSNSDAVNLLCSDIVIDQLLTGVQFINCDNNNNIAASSYDGETIEIWKHNENAEFCGRGRTASGESKS